MENQSRLRPVEGLLKTHKRNLAHWEQPGSIYFVTFRTVDGFMLSDAAKDITFASIKFHADKKYTLHACAVMETHVHSILEPLEQTVAQASLPVSRAFFSLAQILHSVKSYSANRIQRRLGHRGSVWLDENYDRIIRDDDDLWAKTNYIISNPARAGLVSKPEEYRWLFCAGGFGRFDT